jgi:hypothetical protein
MSNELLPAVEYEGVHCHLTIERPTTDIVVLRLAGFDAGEFGDVPMQDLSKDLSRNDLIDLFIDARYVKGASLEVSAEWAQWLGKQPVTIPAHRYPDRLPVHPAHCQLRPSLCRPRRNHAYLHRPSRLRCGHVEIR